MNIDFTTLLQKALEKETPTLVEEIKQASSIPSEQQADIIFATLKASTKVSAIVLEEYHRTLMKYLAETR